MARTSNAAKNAAKKILGTGEPTFNMLDCDDIQLITALNYYALRHTSEDSKRFAIEWATVNHPKIVQKLHKIHPLQFTNIGFLCRIVENGFVDAELPGRIVGDLESIVSTYESREIVVRVIRKAETPVVSRVKQVEQNTMLEQFDYAIDDICTGNPPPNINLVPNSKHLQELINAINKLSDEVKEFPEQYHNSKVLKKFLSQTIDKIENYKKSLKSAKVRKSKPKKIDPLKMVSQLVISIEDGQLGIKGLKPTEIIGATKLIVWHPERRTLSAYISTNESGFLISGRSLKNFDLEKSVTKKIRKPDEMWKAISGLTATRMHYWLRDTCKTTAQPIKALIPDGSVILKV